MQDYKLIRSKRKTIALQIDENAKLIVRAPHHVSVKRINTFIEEKSDWIHKTIFKAESRKKAIQENSKFEDGKIIWFLGRRFKLIISKSAKNISVTGDYINFPYSKLDTAKEYMIKWYKAQAKRIIVPRCIKISEKLRMDVSSVSITSAQKRWGSCTSRGNINFSYRLIMTPVEIIDYVIVHELMHLREMNHSSRFWANVEEIIPDYKECRKWLKNNQHRLIL